MKLKPCPFCGSEDLRRYKLNSFIPEYIHCEVCGGMNGADSWNTRATDPLLKEMADALEELDDMFDPSSRVGEIINKPLQKYHDRKEE